MTVSERVEDLLIKIDHILCPERCDGEFYYDPDYRLLAFCQLMSSESKWIIDNCPDIKKKITSVTKSYEYEYKCDSIIRKMNADIQNQCKAILKGL